MYRRKLVNRNRYYLKHRWPCIGTIQITYVKVQNTADPEQVQFKTQLILYKYNLGHSILYNLENSKRALYMYNLEYNWSCTSTNKTLLSLHMCIINCSVGNPLKIIATHKHPTCVQEFSVRRFSHEISPDIAAKSLLALKDRKEEIISELGDIVGQCFLIFSFLYIHMS